MSNRTVYLRVAIIEEIPTRKHDETVEETVDGFEIEFADLRDARKVLRSTSDALEEFEQFDIMDDGDEDDEEDDDGEDEDVERLLADVTTRVKKHLRKKLR